MSRSAVVLGGGVAGLTAAIELLSRGWRVTILEAKERLGGRVHTVHHGKIPIELGAEFVHGKDPALADLIRQAKLSTRKVSEENRWFKNGRLEPVPLWDRISEIIRRIDPHKPDQTLAAFAEHVLTKPSDRELALGFVQGFDAADPAKASAHALLRAEVSSEHSSGDQQARLKEGYGALVDWMAAEVRKRGGVIHTEAVAHGVNWKHQKVEVHFERGGERQHVSAERALITLPLGVLKTDAVKFRPSLTHKTEAIANLLFGNVRRATFVFSEVWWDKHDFGFVHSFGDAFPTWWSDPRGPVLTAWAGGPKADALNGKTVEELERIGLEILGNIFSEDVSILRERLVAVHTHDWAADPHTRGAYSYLPVLGLDLPKLLADPVDDTLFFAGEATVSDAQMGTVFGAVESARRASKEMSES
jgi:monoamine oxidase